MTVEVNMKQMKQWGTYHSLYFPSMFLKPEVILTFNLFCCSHGTLLQKDFILMLLPLYCSNVPTNTVCMYFSIFTVVWRGIFLMCCWPITAACTLIQTQRPDAHLLLDFFQPTVNLCFSWPAIKIKCAVQLLTNYSAVNPLFKKWKCRKIAFWSLQRAQNTMLET